MISVKETIYQNINYRIDRLRMLADNQPSIFKKLVYLVILDDLYDWAEYLDQPQSIQKKLQKLRQDFIYNNAEIKPKYDNSGKCTYVNVNTPQTNSTWLSVWDQGYILLDPSSVTPEHTPVPHELPYIDDCGNLIIDVTYGNTPDKMVITIEDGLTEEQKMDYYIDKYGRVWYYTDEEPHWHQRAITLTDEDIQKISEQIGVPTTVSISETGTDDNKWKFGVSSESAEDELDIMDDNDLDFV